MVLVEGLVSVSGSLLAAVLLLLLLLLYLSPSGPDPRPEGCRPEPPGPRALPLLGNLLQLDLKRTYRSLCELSKKYGPVFTVSFGPKKVVVLAGYKTVKQALQNQAEEFADRDITPVFHDLNHGHGIIFSNGENWREMRRFALSNLRDFGMGKRGSEEKIIEETRHLVEVLENYKGEPCDTAQPLNHAVSNIISAIVYGNRFEYDDPHFRAMVDRANHNFKLSGSASMQVYNLFPSIGPWVKNRQRLVQNSRENMAEMKSLIAGLRSSLDPSDCRGFVDSFLVRGQSEKESGQRALLFHEENLVNSVSNLFSAGTDTTGTTLRWGLLLMAKYPHVQGRVQEEIGRVIGGRQPVAEDRRSLPFTDAVIHETQRFANVFPMGLPHTTTADVTLLGFHIKKGTSVIPLLTSVLQDEQEWATPHRFNPHHFLDQQGRFAKRDAFLPFSAGRRACLGESLARMELFLFFCTLLQRLRFTPPPGVTEDDLSLTPAVGTTLNPAPHKLCAIPRPRGDPTTPGN